MEEKQEVRIQYTQLDYKNKMKTRRIIFLSCFLAGGLSLFAQVGINIKTPLATFHADPLGNSTSSLTGKYDDDVVFTSNGCLGIGTISPSTQLHIKAAVPGKAFMYQDGSEAVNKVLTSDPFGSVWWEALGAAESVLGNFSSTGVTFSVPAKGILKETDTKMSITLSPGKWIVFASLYIFQKTPDVIDRADALRKAWLSLTWSDTQGGTPSSDTGNKLISGLIDRASDKDILKGYMIINNSSSVTKTYWGILDFTNYANATDIQEFARDPKNGGGQENTVFALRME